MNVPLILEGEMQQNCFNQLKTASQLSNQASDLLRDCSKTDIRVSDNVQESMNAEILRIRVTLSVMRRELSVISGMVNRKSIRRVRTAPI